MYEEEFKKIEEASQNNSLTFFVGAGISRLSNAPGWENLIECFCAKMQYKKPDKLSTDDYLRIPQMFYYSINKDEEEYYRLLNEFLNVDNIKPNSVHKMLFDLNPVSFITTNFDNLLEDAAVQYCRTYKSIACDKEVPQVNGDKFILKIHGDLNHKNIVLKEEDYLSYSDNFKLIETLIKSIFSTNTVVMIGYGLNDNNIKLVLNWAKTLLKDNFNKPIFLYTDDKRLSEAELKYQESRGLKVVEYYNCKGFAETNKRSDFEYRYKLILKSISNNKFETVKRLSDDEKFDLLYSLLEPLDRVWALRENDIKERLLPYDISTYDGAIRSLTLDDHIFEKFIELNQMNDDQLASVSSEVLEKYKLIVRALSKARITQCIIKDAPLNLKNIPDYFADDWCLNFDYSSMNKFISRDYSDIRNNYKKAYYLARVEKFKESYNLFCKVSKAAYAANDYLIYYFSWANANYLNTVLNNVSWSTLYDDESEANEDDSPDIKMKPEYVFDSLPIEFRNNYECFRDIYSANLLYKNAYNAFVEGKKMEKSLEGRTVEIGGTSTDTVISRINSTLHFQLGNGLYVDEFSESAEVIKYLTELLIKKYSLQKRKSSHYSFFGGTYTEPATNLDYIDFYCIVEYFDVTNIVNILNKYKIQNIEFRDPDHIYQNIRNIIRFYDEVVNNGKILRIVSYRRKIQNLMALCRYMPLPDDIMESICNILLKHDVVDIPINEIVMFLDSQVAKYKISNERISLSIQKLFYYYFDANISAIEQGKNYNVRGTTSKINYFNLADYATPGLSERKLAYRINKIIGLNPDKLTVNLLYPCYKRLSVSMKYKVITQMKRVLKSEFNLDYFMFLMSYGIKLDKNIISSAKSYLLKSAENIANTPAGRQYNPKPKYHNDFRNAGFLFLNGILKREDFTELLGYDDLFDFLYLYEGFDFDKFKVDWLLDLTPYALEELGKSDEVKQRIRLKIKETIQGKSLNIADEEQLTQVLIEYFC